MIKQRQEDHLLAIFEGNPCYCKKCQNLVGGYMIDCVNSPEHYQSNCGLEVIDVIDAFHLGFYRGNALKYLLRAGKKDNEIQDLKKAMWYLRRDIKTLEDVEG